MSGEIGDILISRSRSIQALAKSVNLYLVVEGLALRGDEKLAEHIKYIDERVPRSYRGIEGESPFQAFYIGQHFIIMVSEFEGFLVDILRWILRKHPMKIGAETFTLSEILELQDVEAAAGLAAERFLNSLMYKRAAEYRKTLVEILSADEGFLAGEWPQYVECKARRDIGIHNDWLINDTYKRKIREVGMALPTESRLPPANDYFWDTAAFLMKLAGSIAEHCNSKFGS